MKDVLIVEHKDRKFFHLVYQTTRAKTLLTPLEMDNVNFPIGTMPIIEKHFKDNKLTSVGSIEF